MKIQLLTIATQIILCEMHSKSPNGKFISNLSIDRNRIAIQDLFILLSSELPQYSI